MRNRFFDCPLNILLEEKDLLIRHLEEKKLWIALLEAKRDATLDVLRRIMRELLPDMCPEDDDEFGRDLESEAFELERAVSDRMDALKNRHNEEIDALENRHNEEMDALENRHDEEMDALKYRYDLRVRHLRRQIDDLWQPETRDGSDNDGESDGRDLEPEPRDNGGELAEWQWWYRERQQEERDNGSELQQGDRNNRHRPGGGNHNRRNKRRHPPFNIQQEPEDRSDVECKIMVLVCRL